MGKNKRSVFSVVDPRNGETVQVDSGEEAEFYIWCLAAEKLGVVLEFSYQPVTWLLSDRKEFESVLDVGTKPKKKFLFQDHVYSPDFKVKIPKEHFEKFGRYLKLPKAQLDENGNLDVYLDVKGTFQRFDGGKSFSINVKWVYDRYGIYVQKVVPKEAFVKLGVCQELLFTQKTKKPSKKYRGFPSIESVFL